MTDVVRAAEGNFRFGRTLSNSWRVFSANFLKVFLIAIVVTAVYVGLSMFVPRSAVPSSEVPKLAVLIVIGVLAILILYTLAQAAILYVAFQSMRGRSSASSRRCGEGFPVSGQSLASPSWSAAESGSG